MGKLDDVSSCHAAVSNGGAEEACSPRLRLGSDRRGRLGSHRDQFVVDPFDLDAVDLRQVFGITDHQSQIG